MGQCFDFSFRRTSCRFPGEILYLYRWQQNVFAKYSFSNGRTSGRVSCRFCGEGLYLDRWQQNVMCNSVSRTSSCTQRARPLLKSLVSQNLNSIRHESPLKFEALVSNYDNLLTEAFISRRYTVPFILGGRFFHFATFRFISFRFVSFRFAKYSKPDISSPEEWRQGYSGIAPKSHCINLVPNRHKEDLRSAHALTYQSYRFQWSSHCKTFSSVRMSSSRVFSG